MPIARCECGYLEYSVAAVRERCPQCGTALILDERPAQRTWRDHLAGYSSSVGVHLIVLGLLWLFVAPTLASRDRSDVKLDSAWSVAPSSESLSFEAPLDAAADNSTDAVSRTASPAAMAASSASNHSILSHSSTTIDPLRGTASRTPTGPMSPNVSHPRDFLQTFRPLRKSDPRAGGVVASTSTGGALDGILGHLRKESEDSAVQVVWMLDASLSLHIDRQEIAGRLIPFYKEMISRPDKKERPFRSVVVGYGQATAVIQNSTDNVGRVIEAIARMKADPSGLENVFTAVQFALARFGDWKGQTILVIWTDESGDDLPQLEETIRLCRVRHAIVHVVGPQAVLGMERGLQQWTLPQTGQSYLLPVKRGPDAALPERLRVPYWFDSLSPPWNEGEAYIGQGASWFGGPLREGLLSGVGPYSLTRLALETGGTFTTLRRPGEEQAVSWETMRNYLPDYHRADEILADVRREPIRHAVVSAAALTWEADLRPPLRQFFGAPAPDYPYIASVRYLPPEVFQLNLRNALPALMAAAERDQAVIEAALALMDPVRLEPAYQEERLPRWKAWYDLNLGRLLAMSVRLAEYRETLRLMLEGVGVPSGTNFVALVDSPVYKSGRVAEQRAVDARERLQKVTRQHAGTPWARLAAWELEHDLGFVVQPQQVPLPKPGPVRTPTRAPTLPKL
jgi:hypothetical protein